MSYQLVEDLRKKAISVSQTPVPNNVLESRFASPLPNQAWVCDIRRTGKIA